MTADEAIARHHDEIEGAGQLLDRIVNGTIGRVLSHAEASTIFGEPTTQGDCTVIPVGRVSSRYGFGGGAGEGTSGDEDADSGGGGGGGGGGQLDVKPIGYIEITSNDSRFVPITDSSAVAIRAVTMAGIVALFFVIGLFGTIRSRD